MSLTFEGVFAPHIKNALAAEVQKSRNALLPVPFYALSVTLCGLLALGVIAFEFEILYRVFDYLAGEESTFWTPEVMGFSSLILVVAVHFLAQSNADHRTLLFINRISANLLPIYLLGIGTLLAVIIFNDGVLSLLQSDTLWDNSAVENENDWLSHFMETIGSPIAAILFSAGIGALAIINIFVSHHAFNGFARHFKQIVIRVGTYRTDKKDMDGYQNAEKHARELKDDLGGLVIRPEAELQNDVATDILLAIDDALKEPRAALAQAELMNSPIELPQSLNAEQLKKAMKALDGITRDQIFKHFH
ncbi:hypothetical protein [Alteromonas sp. a30]|uniref:hypothetical protein n=1 Tax=Alteromonas sp. a30 TaxID=2730917 RepID=UPI0022811F2A|nr:hypothetical protein [Alteromonas sp. a30]MCY7297387.1 hypothetical protein [Alteromonas sp. a30]